MKHKNIPSVDIDCTPAIIPIQRLYGELVERAFRDATSYGNARLKQEAINWFKGETPYQSIVSFQECIAMIPLGHVSVKKILKAVREANNDQAENYSKKAYSSKCTDETLTGS